MATAITDEMITSFKEAFAKFDTDGYGYITIKQLRAAIKSLDQDPHADEIQDLINEAYGKGTVEFPEFLNMMATLMKVESPEARLRAKFQEFDKDGSGAISMDELRDVIKSLDQKLSDKELDAIVYESDIDGDGEITYDEFIYHQGWRWFGGKKEDTNDKKASEKPSSEPKAITDEQISCFKEAFTKFDTDGYGYITIKQLRAAIKSLDQDPHADEIQDLINEAYGKGTVEFPEFLNMMATLMKVESPEARLRAKFQEFDKDGSGAISMDELREVIKSLDQKLSDKELDAIVYESDIDGDGEITYDEFIYQQGWRWFGGEKKGAETN